MQSLLRQKQQEQDQKMKLMVEVLKSKGNKKASFQLMRHADKDKLMASLVDHYKLHEFRPRSDLSQHKSTSPAFQVSDQGHSLVGVPLKEVKVKNVILNAEWSVQPPDMQIAGNNNYEVSYLRNMNMQHNVYCKKSTDLTVVNEVKPMRQAIGRPEHGNVD